MLTVTNCVTISMPRTGRPKKEPEERRNKHLAVRVTEAELAQIEQAAQKDGKGTTTWAREILLAQVILPANHVNI